MAKKATREEDAEVGDLAAETPTKVTREEDAEVGDLVQYHVFDRYADPPRDRVLIAVVTESAKGRVRGLALGYADEAFDLPASEVD